MLINIARDLCIGAAPCVAIDGDVFQLGSDGIAIKVGESTNHANTKLAAEACPVRAIFLYEDDQTTQIFPPAEELARPYQEEPIIKN